MYFLCIVIFCIAAGFFKRRTLFCEQTILSWQPQLHSIFPISFTTTTGARETHIPLKFQAKTLIIKNFYCNFSNNCILLFSKMSETFDYVLVCCLVFFPFISCNRWKITLLVVYLWTGFCKELVPVIVLQASFPEFVNCLYKCIISYRIQMSSFSCCMLFCVDVLDKLCVA